MSLRTQNLEIHAPLRLPPGRLRAGALRISTSYVLHMNVLFASVGCGTYLGCQVVGWNVGGICGDIQVGVIWLTVHWSNGNDLHVAVHAACVGIAVMVWAIWQHGVFQDCMLVG